MVTRRHGHLPERQPPPARLDAYGPTFVRLVLGPGSAVAAVGCPGRVHAHDLPALRPTRGPGAGLMAGHRVPRRRRRGWLHDSARNIWTHTPTGLRFSGQMVAHYGWEEMASLCVEIVGWRQFIEALPETDLREDRDRLLADAMACGDDEGMRALTLRWTLWHEETDAVTGGTNDGR